MPQADVDPARKADRRIAIAIASGSSRRRRSNPPGAPECGNAPAPTSRMNGKWSRHPERHGEEVPPSGVTHLAEQVRLVARTFFAASSPTPSKMRGRERPEPPPDGRRPLSREARSRGPVTGSPVGPNRKSVSRPDGEQRHQVRYPYPSRAALRCSLRGYWPGSANARRRLPRRRGQKKQRGELGEHRERPPIDPGGGCVGSSADRARP